MTRTGVRAPREGTACGRRRRSFGRARRAGDELGRRVAPAGTHRRDHRAGYRPRPGHHAHPGPRLPTRAHPAGPAATHAQPGPATGTRQAAGLGTGSRRGARPRAGRDRGRLRRLRRDAGLPRRPQAGRADRRPRGERPARSGKPAGGPDDAPRVHRRAECPAASRHRHRDPAAAGDHSTGSRCATQPGSGSGCVRAGRSFWSPGARRAPGRSTPRCPARPRRCGRPACRCCTSPGRSTWSRCRTAATPTRPTSPSPTSGKCSTPTLRPTS